MPLDLACIEALCFDVDGTLSDTDDVLVSRLSNWLNILGFLFPNCERQKIARRMVMAIESPAQTIYGLPDRLNVDTQLAKLSELFRRFVFGGWQSSFQLIPNVVTALMELRTRYPLSIVSARDEYTTHTFLHQCGLETMFGCVVTAQTTPHTKPYPDPVLWAANQMGVPPNRCLMIGDTIVDMRAGKSAGAQTVGVLSGFGQEGELIRSGADLILASVAELPRILLP